jgi:class 3 adenylate cyclase
VTCGACGAPAVEGARFCAQCGSPLAAATATREERKVVTVLFADLVGFTSRSERLDPEDVRALQTPYWGRLRAEIERFGGTVEKFIGDAVVAVFGAPVIHEDDPERAVRAAFAIRDAVGELEEDLHVRVAVATGEALVAVGARLGEGEGIASGDVVNTAARLQAAAPVVGVLVSEPTYRATERTIEYRPADPVSAKGKSAPVEVWEAVAPRARLGVDVEQRSRVGLVGRQAELSLLTDALGRARRERNPQLVTLVGVPGIGKSRLVWELARVVDAEPDLVYWRQGRSLPYGEGVTFWALGEMVKAQAGVLDTDDAAAAAAKLTACVSDFVADPGEAAWVGDRLRPLIGVGGSEAGADRGAEAFAAWRRFFEAMAERSPLVLVFEDLHWADEGLLDFVDHLADWASGVPLLLLATARPELLERRPGWGGGKRNASTVSLSPLSDEETARLIAGALDRAVLPADAQAAILARAGGTPLYAEEYARMLRTRGDDAGAALPETIQGIVAARVDSLPLEEKELLQAAAVVGKVFWTGALAGLRELPRWTVEERLHALERKEFVRRERRSSVASETEYAFRHVLVRDAAYNQIPRSGRAEKHRAVAEWIAGLAADRAEDRAEMLAHHYLSALQFGRASGQDVSALTVPARVALREAGQRALALNAFPAAGRFFESALELWPDGDPERPRLLFELLVTRSVTGDIDSELLLEARAGLLDAGDVAAAARLDTLLAWHHAIHGARDAGLEYMDHGVSLVRDLPPSTAKAYVLGQAAVSHMVLDEHARALELGREELAIAEELGLADEHANALTTIGCSRVFDGDLGGLADVERGIELARAANAPLVLSRAYKNFQSILLDLGEPARAQAVQREGLAFAEGLGLGNDARWFRAELALIDLLQGRWADAEAAVEAFLADVAAGSPHYMESACRWARSVLAVARGDLSVGCAEAETFLELGRGVRDPQTLCPALGWTARARLEAGRIGEAAALVDEFFSVWEGQTSSVWSWAPDIAVALVRLGRGQEMAGITSRARMPTPWLEAAGAYAAGEFSLAADLYARIGVAMHEADARLRAAELHMAEGDRTAADGQLGPALAFYRSVAATARVAEGEALRAVAS